MRLILSLLLVSLSLSQQVCDPYDNSSLKYTISSNVLSTTDVGPIVLPIYDTTLYENNDKALGLITELNGGAIRLFFAHRTDDSKRLLWNVEPSTADQQTSVQLCVDSDTRHCYTRQDVDVDPAQPLTIQVKSQRTASYIRFSISLSDDPTAQSCEVLSSSPQMVTLSQVFRLSDFPDSEEWMVEAQQGTVDDAVTVSQVAVLGMDDEDIIVSLWNEGCQSYQHLADVYEAISGAAPTNNFRPQLRSIFQESYFGPKPEAGESDTCELSVDSCNEYRFNCPKGSSNPHEPESLPAFCLKDVKGNFLITGLASESTNEKGYVGLLMKEFHTTKEGLFVSPAVSDAGSERKFTLRYFINGKRDEQPNDFGAGFPLYMGMQRMGGKVEVRYHPASVTPVPPFSGWNSDLTPKVGPVLYIQDVPEEFDLCVIFAAKTQTGVEGKLKDVKLTLLPDEDESESE